MRSKSLKPQTIHISIVTPCYNGAPYIERAIHNVVEQKVDGLEHIIVDGGSTDGTLDILRRYPHLRWISEPDSGQANALNKGFRLALGEVIGWLNGDDTYTAQAVQIGLDYLLSHPDCDIVYGNCNILRADGRLLTVFRSRQASGYETLLGDLIHTPAVFFRRRLLDLVGYLDEDMHYVLDNEFWLRVAPVAKMTYLPIALANFRHEPGSKSMQQAAEFGPEMCRVYVAAFGEEPYQSQIPLSVQRSVLARYHWYTGINLVRNGQPERALPYLQQAIAQYDALQDLDMVVECLVTRYMERDVLAWDEVTALVEALPVSKAVKRQVMCWAKDRYSQIRFYTACNRQDWAEVRTSGWDWLRQSPNLLVNRGFLSHWGESWLGSGAMGLLRRFV